MDFIYIYIRDEQKRLTKSQLKKIELYYIASVRPVVDYMVDNLPKTEVYINKYDPLVNVQMYVPLTKIFQYLLMNTNLDLIGSTECYKDSSLRKYIQL